MKEITYEIQNLGGVSLREYACTNLAEALYREYPRAISLLQDRVDKRNRNTNGEKEGLIAIACSCPCCDGHLWQELDEIKQLRKDDYHVLLVSPLPGIDPSGIKFDFISTKRPEFRPNTTDACGNELPDGKPRGNNEEYIHDFVDGVLALLK